ncbi:MAG: cyclase family protein [Luteitalea sp.]|nr:cyclase family protein [Luteitalea sp.]
MALILITVSASAWAQVASNVAAKSPWGPDDEIGTLNMMTDASRLKVVEQIAGGKVYDLSVDIYVGMPDCCGAFGDPSYQIWMTHTPQRTAAGTAPEANPELLSYSGDAISMYTHTGTHIDALNHFGFHGNIWNQVSADDALDARGWTRSGVDTYPPIIARGILIDVATSKGVDHLPESYTVTARDLQDALKEQGTVLQPGDVVLIRTGLMSLWPDRAEYRLDNQAGLGLEAAQWLVDARKAMLLGADNFGVDSFPSKNPDNFVPVHSYLFAERGVSIIEVMWLEDLAKDQVYEFLFIAAPLKLRGATASPIRPLAMPIQRP